MAEEQKSTRKPYQVPQLFEYGDINDLTQGSGTNGASEGGTGQPNTAA